MACARPKNPFSPTFGTTPPLLAGRDTVLERFNEALDTGPAHPDYTLLITGNRGTGKTALLNALEEQAAVRGWLTITVAASSEPVSVRVGAEAQLCIQRLSRGRRGAHLSSLSVMGVGVAFSHVQRSITDSRSMLSTLEELGGLLRSADSGVLVTVDELHDIGRDEVRDLASAIQIVTRRRLHPMAFAAAALPLIEHTHLADVNMTFLQRCARARLGRLSPHDTRCALSEPIIRSGSAINADALEEAADATLGFPYTIQLVGFHAWRTREDPKTPISLDDVRVGAVEAEHAMIEQIAGPIWNRLSPMDKRFLAAMLTDDADSALTDIAHRIRRSPQYARTYRRRLIAAGAISPASKARVRFSHHAIRARTRSAVRENPDLIERAEGKTTTN